MKFILLINVEMPTVVGKLTFISKKKTLLKYLRVLKHEFFFTKIFVFMRN